MLLAPVLLAFLAWSASVHSFLSANFSVEAHGRRLSSDHCDNSAGTKAGYQEYFSDIEKIYGFSNTVKTGYKSTCLPVHQKCGWPKVESSIHQSKTGTAYKDLPLFVISVGLEGAGHHLWTEMMQPLFDCNWINARHYMRNVGDGIARTTSADLSMGIREQFAMRAKNQKPPCKSIYDAEDSFPTGAIRRPGRCFMRPDIVNLEQLDGVLFRVKYLIILRNTTDTALSSLRRNFFTQVDLGLRCVEDTLIYLEAALRGVPCHRLLFAHYEHVLAKPSAYEEPLSDFLELDGQKRAQLSNILKAKDKGEVKFPKRTQHKLTQYSECKGAGLGDNLEKCYNTVVKKVESFLADRAFMWPSLAGNGYALKP
jgi:hypothetical protein